MIDTIIKTYKNSLIAEKLLKLSIEDRNIIVTKLLEGTTERKLSEELGIPHSTLHDWKSKRQNNTKHNIHVSLSLIIRRLRYFKPKNSDDYIKLKKIFDLTKNKLTRFSK